MSIEHKLGIHASPTAVLAFGDKEGAIGWLVGEENRGLETMFIMMNAERFSVGLEGIRGLDLSVRTRQHGHIWSHLMLPTPSCGLTPAPENDSRKA